MISSDLLRLLLLLLLFLLLMVVVVVVMVMMVMVEEVAPIVQGNELLLIGGGRRAEGVGIGDLLGGSEHLVDIAIREQILLQIFYGDRDPWILGLLEKSVHPPSGISSILHETSFVG